MRYVNPGNRPPVALPELDTAEKSLVWADAEATNLAAAVERAAADGRDDYTLLLALGCVGYLYHRGHVQQISKVLELATEATRRSGDTEAEARVLTATAHVLRGRQGNRASVEVLREALGLLTPDSSQQLRAQILSALGNKLVSIDPYGEALPSLEESTRLARSVKDDRTLAMSLTYAGLLHGNALDNDNALRCLNEALDVFERLGPMPLKADALCGLSTVHYRLEQASEAIATATAAYDLAAHLNNRFSKSQALANLGAAHRLGGDLEKAVEVHRKALAASKFSGSVASTWAAHLNLGDSLLELGDFESAKNEFEEVFQPATQDKDNLFLMLALEGLAGSAAGLGDKQHAADLLQEAIAIADEHVPNYAAQFREKLAALAV
jgi:tetratricopeptide (TPR) repeat protein